MKQTTNSILIRPVAFRMNEQTTIIIIKKVLDGLYQQQ
jgi:hypothetical protein